MGSASGLTAPVYYDGKNLRTDTAMILVEDQNGVYFWTEGSGETIADCIDDASAGVTFTMTDVAWGKFVNEINGLASTDDFSGYWSLYILENGEWVSSDLGVSSLTTEDNPVVGFFYVEAETEEPYGIVAGGPDNVIVPSISSAKVWDGKTDGTIFGSFASSDFAFSGVGFFKRSSTSFASGLQSSAKALKNGPRSAGASATSPCASELPGAFCKRFASGSGAEGESLRLLSPPKGPGWGASGAFDSL